MPKSRAFAQSGAPSTRGYVVELFDPRLLEHVEEQRAFNQVLVEMTGQMGAIDPSTPEGLQWVRDAMEPGGLFGMQSLDFAEVREIPGPTGPISVRVLVPDEVRGVLLHFHGGGMTVGSAAGSDGRNWRMAKSCNVATVSVDYRLAPEHPYPSGPDDCEAAALWLIEHARDEFGTDRLLVGGESAGAYLSILTMLRLRDRLGARPPFVAMDLEFGGYDFGGTPSARLMAGKVPFSVGGESGNREHYLPGRSVEECRDPAVSPLWAELHDLPPAVVSVGTADWLLDDSVFLAARLAVAGNEVDLAVWPECPHGIVGMPTTLGRMAAERVDDFLRAHLDRT